MKANRIKRKMLAERDTMRPEYDFSNGVRGKHAARYAAGTNVVILNPRLPAHCTAITRRKDTNGKA